MVRQPASHIFKEIVPPGKRLQQVHVVKDRIIGHLFQFVQVRIVHLRIIRGHRFVGSPGGQYLYFESIIPDLFVVFKAVDRIVCCADHLHIHLPQEVFHAERIAVQHLFGFLIDLLRCIGTEQLFNTEIASELQVGPMVQRIAKCGGYRFCPFHEFFLVGCVARTVFFADTVGTHRPPFIVIPR